MFKSWEWIKSKYRQGRLARLRIASRHGTSPVVPEDMLQEEHHYMVAAERLLLTCSALGTASFSVSVLCQVVIDLVLAFFSLDMLKVKYVQQTTSHLCQEEGDNNTPFETGIDHYQGRNYHNDAWWEVNGHFCNFLSAAAGLFVIESNEGSSFNQLPSPVITVMLDAAILYGCVRPEPVVPTTAGMAASAGESWRGGGAAAATATTTAGPE